MIRPIRSLGGALALALPALVAVVPASAQDAAASVAPAPESPGLDSSPQAPVELGPELLVGHPAIATGDVEALSEAILTALERDPGSPYALDAVGRLRSLLIDDHTHGREFIERVGALRDRVADEDVEFRLEELWLTLAVRTRLAEDPVPMPPDLRDEYIGQWRVIAPLGPPDEGALALAGPLEGSPEPRAADGGPLATGDRWQPAREYPATMTLAGQLRNALVWRPAERVAHWSTIEVAPDAWPEAGYGFALAYVRVEGLEAPQEMLLEVRGTASHRVHWNGALVLDRPRLLPSDAREKRLVPVVVQPGWNAILGRVLVAEGPRFGARLLTLDGGEVRCEELPADANELPAVEVTPPAEAASPERVEELSEEEAGPFAPALNVVRYLEAGRPDLALTVEPPRDERGANAWRVRTIGALEMAQHIDREAWRRRVLALLDEIEATGVDHAFVTTRRINFDQSEDRPLEALARAREWVRRDPSSGLAATVLATAYEQVDSTSTMTRIALEDAVRNQPGNRRARALLAMALDREGVRSRAADLAWDLVESSGDATSVGRFIDVLDGAPDPRVEVLLARVRRALGDFPDDPGLRQMENDALGALGRREEMLARSRERTEEAPGDPDTWWDLAYEALQEDRVDEARAALERELALRPSDPTSRALLVELGVEDPAERFFQEFAPDREAAMERARAAEQASVVEVLDSGLIFVFADGSTHSRNTSIGYATDRAGVEALSTRPIQEGTRSIRVEKADGTVLEPTDAGGEWVMPSLEIGDVVEVVWDQHLPSPAPGAAPFQHVWRFASFERAFPTSRWVVRVPDGLARGRVVARNFEGERREVDVPGGTVHVLSESMPRQIGEPAMPPYERVLPLAGFGADSDRESDLRSYRAYVTQGTYLPADIEAEVAAFARATAEAAQGEGDLARAKALYDALDDRAQDFQGDPNPASVWQTRRGWPLFLFAATLDALDVPYEWGVLETGVSPELQPHPETLFENDFALGQVILRLGGAEDPVWVLPGNAPGTPFGELPTQAAGARVLLVEDGAEANLPRAYVDDRFDAEVTLTYEVAADGSATVRGKFANAGPDGVMALGQVREATAQQRQGFALGQAGQFARGADITRAGVVLDGSEGPGLVVTFEGDVPRFAVPAAGGGALDATLPFLPLQLTQRFGPVERRWPLEIRSPFRLRVSVTLRVAPELEVGAGPAAVTEERDGFLVGLDVERSGGADGAPTELVYVQRLEQTALVLAPEEMQPFLERMADLEDEFGRPLRLTPR